MATGGRETNVENVNNVNKEFKNQGTKPIVNKKAAGSAIGSDVLSQMLGDRTLRKRSVMPVNFNFATPRFNQISTKENTASTTSASASFFGNASSGITLNPPCPERSTTIKKVLPLSSSQPHVAEEPAPIDVPLSTNVEHPRAAGKGASRVGTRASAASRAASRAGTRAPTASVLSQSVQQSENDEDDNCPFCRVDVKPGEDSILCEMCFRWSHRECLSMTRDTLDVLNSSDEPWCLSIKSNKIKWGAIEGEIDIKAKILNIYDEITKWRKNLFMVPRGKVGTDFIKEITRILKLFTTPTKWSRIALAKLHIFIPLMLQKPSAKSKAKEHSKYLAKRLQLWNDGDLDSILSENREIQKKLKRTQDKKKESREKAFCRLMLLGKVSQSMKFVNSEDDTKGVHQLTDKIKKLLEEKHPRAREASRDILIPPSANDPEPVIYERIDSTAVHKAAKQIQGSGGPTLIDADGWRHILCSKSYGKASNELCEAIADLAKKLCREAINPDTLREFIANRLIPLDKGEDKEGNPGVRPIGIGEILRRIVGKVVVENIREDIIEAAGPLQTCAGLKSGIEASVHAMRKIFEKDDTEAVLLVDAENAFNNFSRKAALHNIKELCPPFHRYLSNTYQIPANMIVNDQVKTETITSEEGSTQGDVAAMGMYAIGTRPLIDILQRETDSSICQQVMVCR